MDQNEKAGNNYSELSPEAKLEQLRRYREYCNRGDVDHQFIAEDYFCEAVVNDNLAGLYTQQEIARERSRLALAN